MYKNEYSTNREINTCTWKRETYVSQFLLQESCRTDRCHCKNCKYTFGQSDALWGL